MDTGLRPKKWLLAGLAVGAASLSVGPLAAQSRQDTPTPAGTEMTLREALALAWETSPALKADNADLRATGELAAQARAEGMPRLNAQLSIESADGSYEPGRDLGPLLESFGLPPMGGGEPGDPGQPPLEEALDEVLTGNGGAGTRQAGLVLEQPLFQGFRVKNGIRRARARIDAAEAQLAGSEQALFLDVVAAYFDVVTARETAEVQMTSLRLLRSQEEEAGVRFETGQATRTDTATAEARAAQAEAELIRARAALQGARTRLARLTGRMPAQLAPEPPLPNLPPDLDAARNAALSGNPDLAAAREAERAAEYGVKVAKGYLAPSVTARASYGYAENQFLEGDRSSNATIGAEVRIPLYQGGATYSGIRRAREEASAARYRRIDAERAVLEAVDIAWQQLEAARAAYEATAPAVAASELAYEGLALEGRLGRRSTLDVLDGESQLLRTRLSRLEARQAYYLAAYRLLGVTGGLTAEALGLD